MCPGNHGLWWGRGLECGIHSQCESLRTMCVLETAPSRTGQGPPPATRAELVRPLPLAALGSCCSPPCTLEPCCTLGGRGHLAEGPARGRPASLDSAAHTWASISLPLIPGPVSCLFKGLFRGFLVWLSSGGCPFHNSRSHGRALTVSSLRSLLEAASLPYPKLPVLASPRHRAACKWRGGKPATGGHCQTPSPKTAEVHRLLCLSPRASQQGSQSPPGLVLRAAWSARWPSGCFLVEAAMSGKRAEPDLCARGARRRTRGQPGGGARGAPAACSARGLGPALLRAKGQAGGGRAQGPVVIAVRGSSP